MRLSAALALLLPIACAHHPAHDWRCNAIATNPGPEDFELDGSRLIVAAHPPQAISIGAEGQLMPAEPLRLVPDFKFEPIGISLVHDGGKTLLYAINKGIGIEVLEVGEHTLTRTRDPLHDPLITNPNEVLGTAGGQIYVSNMSRYGRFGGSLSNLFNLRTGNVVHYDGSSWRVAATPIRFGNGMLISPDGTKMWVAAFGEHRLHVYDRDPRAGTLTHRSTIDTVAHPDNLQWESYPLLDVATHPSYVRTGLHVVTGGFFRSPSEARQINVETGENNLLFTDDGTKISAASTALLHGDHLYLSQIKRPAVLDCRRMK